MRVQDSRPEPGPGAAVDFDTEPDFAAEHSSLSVADGDYGPEGVPEHETPHGYGGADWSTHRQLLV
ncbi:MAG: hypothetical protein HOV79_29920 [Hamadaea sp.]|nr:hypothetical protein [Hamadaea sp.]